MGGLKTVAAQAGDVQEDIGHAVVRHDEAEALGDVEPLDPSADLDEGDRPFRLLSPRSLNRCAGPARPQWIGLVIVGHERTHKRIAPRDSPQDNTGPSQEKCERRNIPESSYAGSN